MSLTNQKQDTETEKAPKVNQERLEKIIDTAIQKVGGSKENDLCKYLPVPAGGYMHHFTLRKMKTEDPDKLLEMIEKFIVKVEKPGRVTPKPRAARGSRKKRDQITLTKEDLDRLLSIARLAGDQEVIAKLTPKKSLTQIKKELIASIRNGTVEQELWNSYVETLNAQNTTNLMSSSLRLGNEFQGASFGLTTDKPSS